MTQKVSAWERGAPAPHVVCSRKAGATAGGSTERLVTMRSWSSAVPGRPFLSYGLGDMHSSSSAVPDRLHKRLYVVFVLQSRGLTCVTLSCSALNSGSRAAHG
jgi:hypothetical protein